MNTSGGGWLRTISTSTESSFQHQASYSSLTAEEGHKYVTKVTPCDNGTATPARNALLKVDVLVPTIPMNLIRDVVVVVGGGGGGGGGGIRAY